jgi:alanyl-tRNA synthetase
MQSDQVRRQFIEFFKVKPGPGPAGHTFVPSSPVVPHDDPTLLFTNAGMNQFKPIFLGQAAPGSTLAGLKRAANSQKCIRAGGKHNDLDDVGKDTYHHTFFEMLGNWSFGDYFKAESIAWGFEFLTKVCGIDASRLYATYFRGEPEAGLDPDTEARDLWLRHLPASHILPGNMKDNFWEMGETGPCGPCSEVHYDRIGNRDASRLVNTGDPDVIEIWNHVFIQFNREDTGKLRSLPARHVDTGMGFERLVSVLQNVRSNYDTDIFAPIFMAIEGHTGARPYTGHVGPADKDGIDTAYRVIADHIRTLTFAITDGAVPSNEGRGYVLRRILRRAVRFGRQKLGAKGGFFSQLVPVVVEKMGSAFPELKKDPQRVISILKEEEESFGRTLDRGIKLFAEAADRAGAARQVAGAGYKDFGIISAEDAFTLYDTFGFPPDLTVLMAEERGLKVDVEGYERLMEEARIKSRGGAKSDSGEARLTLDAAATARLAHMKVQPTDDSDKFHGREIRATIKAIWNGQNFDEASRASTDVNARVGLILDRTSFYPEMGGQETDTGDIVVSRENRSSARESTLGGGEFRVESVKAFAGFVLHVGRVGKGEVRVGDDVNLRIDRARRGPIASNHTATHLFNHALRQVVGDGADQKGSLVAPDRFRFDFSAAQPVAAPQLAQIESTVRKRIDMDLTVYTDLAPLAQARKINGLRAVFGEAYPDPVRIVSIGQPVKDLLDDPENPAWREVSVEFCGGTHIESTKEASDFAIISEEAVAKGIRRIVAITGVPAQAARKAADNLGARIQAAGKLEGDALVRESSDINSEIDSLTLPVARKADLRAALATLQDRVKDTQKHAAAAIAGEAVQQARAIADAATTAQERVIIATIPTGSNRSALLAALRTIQTKCPRAAAMLFSPDHEGGKVSIVAAVPPVMVLHGFSAGDWVREASAVVGGKGGGKPDSAQGGGTDLSKIKEAIAAADLFARRKIG